VFKKIKLKNQFEVLLIHDPDVKKSAAAIDVNVGSLEDPKDSPGLSHFLEHMLFLGTEKYPEIGQFKSLLNNHQGYSNAYTALEHTNYYFEVNHDAFTESLDQFAQFFIAPLFSPEYLEREQNAIHSEYQKNLQEDSWRVRQIEQILNKSGHPTCRVFIGNLDTLKGVTRDKMIEFYRKYYSANMMKMSLISNLKLDKQERLVKKLFTPIKNTNRQKIVYDPVTFDESKLPQFIQIRPLSNKHILKLVFEAPSVHEYWKTKPTAMLGHLIGYEGEGSLLSQLKKEDLVTSLSAGVGSSSFNGYIVISMDLTKEGFKHIDSIISRFFSFIRLLNEQGYKKYLFHEIKKMDEINFDYRDIFEGANLVSSYASIMHYFSALDLDRTISLLHQYSLKDFRLFLNRIKPELMRVVLISPDVKTNKKEEYFGTHYSVRTLPDKQWKKWQRARIRKSMYYPPPNEFIPKRLQLLRGKVSKKPYKLIDDERGVLWFKQNQTFKLPKAHIHLLIHSDKVNSDPRSKLLSIIYIKTLNESLSEWRYPIELGGLSFDVSRHNRGLVLRIEGFSERIPNLISALFKKLMECSIDQKMFQALKTDLKREYVNQNYDQAYRQCFYQLRMITDVSAIHRDEYQHLVDQITMSELKSYIRDIYTEIAIEGLVYGNLKPSVIKNVIGKIYSILGAKVLPKSKRLLNEMIKLPLGKPVDSIISSQSNNNCWARIVHFGKRTVKLNGVLRLGASYLEPGFYNELRTKQQLGYIISSGLDFHEKVLGMYFVIQSAEVDAGTLSKRADKWLVEAVNGMADMTDEHFNTIKNAVIEKLRWEDRTMRDRFERYLIEALSLEGKFDYSKDVAKAAKKITKKDLVEVFKHAFSPANRSQLTVYHVAKGKKITKVPKHVVKDINKFKAGLELYN